MQAAIARELDAALQRDPALLAAAARDAAAAERPDAAFRRFLGKVLPAARCLPGYRCRRTS
jgi:hypothetical protein